MKKIGIRIAVIIIVLGTLCFNYSKNIKAKCFDGELMIYEMAQSINDRDWDIYKSLMSYDEQGFYTYYFSNDEYTDGIKQIETMNMVECCLLSDVEVQGELLYEEYSILSNSNDVLPYLVSFDCVVNEETAYFYNGLNYFLIVIAQENDGEYRIAQFNRPSYQFLSAYIESKKCDSYEITKDDNVALNVVKCAENGVLVNGEGELITDGYMVKIKDKKTNEVKNLIPSNGKVSTYALNNYSSTPNLDAYFYYTVPKKITVKLNKTGNGEIKTVKLNNYIKNTIPNEWYTTWKKASLKAAAYCVKGVAIYRSIKPINVNYMVSQSTQMYVPKTAVTNVSEIVDAIDGQFMVNSDGKIFFPEYGAGSQGVAGTKGSGRLLQWGSQYLASEKGYTFKKILNYYYKGSPYSTGKLLYINYGEV